MLWEKHRHSYIQVYPIWWMKSSYLEWLTTSSWMIWSAGALITCVATYKWAMSWPSKIGLSTWQRRRIAGQCKEGSNTICCWPLVDCESWARLLLPPWGSIPPWWMQGPYKVAPRGVWDSCLPAWRLWYMGHVSLQPLTHQPERNRAWPPQLPQVVLVGAGVCAALC